MQTTTSDLIRVSTRRTPLWGAALALAVMLMLQASPTWAEDGIARADTGQKRIGFSNSHAGNSFRQVMIKSWQEVVKQARKDGLIGNSPVVSANNSVTEQAAHIQNMILQGYDAIVTQPCAYQVNHDWASYGQQEVDYVAQRLKGKGNLLEIRGIAGDSTDWRLLIA